MVPADFSIIHFEDLNTQSFLLIFPFSDWGVSNISQGLASLDQLVQTNFRYLQLVVTSALIQRWINIAEG